MTSTPPTLERWLDLALEVLRSDGYSALKALRLAKMLGLTRGSFYHHFESLEQFHTAVIAHWSKRTTAPVIETASAQASPEAALDTLLQVTLNSGEALERAIRSWATVSPQVAKEVEMVDRARIEVAADLLRRVGLPDPQAEARSRLLYWAAIGRLMMPFPDNNRLSTDQIEDITRLMTRR